MGSVRRIAMEIYLGITQHAMGGCRRVFSGNDVDVKHNKDGAFDAL